MIKFELLLTITIRYKHSFLEFEDTELESTEIYYTYACSKKTP